MKFCHSARVALQQRALGLLSSQSNEERTAAPAQRVLEQIDQDDSTRGKNDIRSGTCGVPAKLVDDHMKLDGQ